MFEKKYIFLVYTLKAKPYGILIGITINFGLYAVIRHLSRFLIGAFQQFILYAASASWSHPLLSIKEYKTSANDDFPLHKNNWRKQVYQFSLDVLKSLMNRAVYTRFGEELGR